MLDTLVKGLDGFFVAPSLEINNILTVYQSLSKKSPVKKWLSDRAARSWDAMLLLHNVATGFGRIHKLPQGFLIKVLAQTKHYKDLYPPLDPCDYHGHKRTEEENLSGITDGWRRFE